ncbi:MAG: hypothetical protein ACP5XB_14960 [Isosphaeraceae bacterium]
MASTNQTEETTSPIDPARDFLEFWRNYFEQTAIQTRILLESMQGGKSLEQMHDQWLGPLSQSLDSFMRAPAFLEVLKQTLQRMIDLKVLQDQMAQTAARQSATVQSADLSSLCQRVHSVEQTILARLAGLDDRLKAIEERLSASPAEQSTA